MPPQFTSATLSQPKPTETSRQTSSTSERRQELATLRSSGASATPWSPKTCVTRNFSSEQWGYVLSAMESSARHIVPSNLCCTSWAMLRRQPPPHLLAVRSIIGHVCAKPCHRLDQKVRAHQPQGDLSVTLAYGAIGAHTYPSVAVPRSATPRVSAYASSAAPISAVAVPALPVLIPATVQDQPPVATAPPAVNVPFTAVPLAVTTAAVPATGAPAGYIPPWHDPANPAAAGSAAPANALATPASQAAFTTPFLQRRVDILNRVQAAQTASPTSPVDPDRPFGNNDPRPPGLPQPFPLLNPLDVVEEDALERPVQLLFLFYG